MPVPLILLSLLGIGLFGIRAVTDPASWLTSVLGIAVCLFVCARSAKVIRSNRRITSTPSVREVRDPATLDEALVSERAILYKHSTSCAVSAGVVDEVLQFAGTHPDWRIYVLRVIERRELSDTAAERLGVPHKSPQAFVIRQGRSVWHASHDGITAQKLSQEAGEGRCKVEAMEPRPVASG